MLLELLLAQTAGYDPEKKTGEDPFDPGNYFDAGTVGIAGTPCAARNKASSIGASGGILLLRLFIKLLI